MQVFSLLMMRRVFTWARTVHSIDDIIDIVEYRGIGNPGQLIRVSIQDEKVD